MRSTSAQGTTGLMLIHVGLEEVTLLLQVDDLAHPQGRIFFVRKHRIQADLYGTTVGAIT